MKLMPPERNLQVLKDDYDHMQNMIFGEKIPFDTIFDGIEKLEKEIAEWKIPENEARGIESAEALIAELYERNKNLELARAKGDKNAADEYKKNLETIAFYRAKIKEASDPINAKKEELTQKKVMQYSLLQKNQVELKNLQEK